MCVVINKIDLQPAETQAANSPRGGLSPRHDRLTASSLKPDSAFGSIRISAKTGAGLDELRKWLSGSVDAGFMGSATISSARHHEALVLARESLSRVLAGLCSGLPTSRLPANPDGDVCPLTPSAGLCSGLPTDLLACRQESAEDFRCNPTAGLSTDLLAEELRETLHHLGLITGEVTTNEILGSIFSKFCIGK